MSLYVLIFIEEFPMFVIVRFHGKAEPGFVDIILQSIHHKAFVSQLSYCPAAFGRSMIPFPQ